MLELVWSLGSNIIVKLSARLGVDTTCYLLCCRQGGVLTGLCHNTRIIVGIGCGARRMLPLTVTHIHGLTEGRGLILRKPH